MKKKYSGFPIYLLTHAAILLILLCPSAGIAGVSFGVHLGYGYYGHPYGYGHHYAYPYGYYGHHYAYLYDYYGYTGYYYPYRSYPLHRTYPEAPTGNRYHGNRHTTGGSMGTDSPAWTILAQGKSRAALRIFAEEAENHPGKGAPKVGYALASASSGDLNRGVWAMRRAFRIDPDSLDYLHFDEKALTVINQLIGKYQVVSLDHRGGPDSAFMVSALNYLRHDYKTAHEALNQAIEGGDKSVSLTNLQKLLREQSSPNPGNSRDRR